MINLGLEFHLDLRTPTSQGSSLGVENAMHFDLSLLTQASDHKAVLAEPPSQTSTMWPVSLF